MDRRLTGGELADLMPRETWFNASAELDRLYPGSDYNERQRRISALDQKLNSLYKWGYIDKKIDKRRAYWWIPHGVTACP